VVGRLIAIANQKGGVGKTTTAVNLAIGLAAHERRVLLVDLDPQGNATSGLVPDSRFAQLKNSQRTIYQSIVGRYVVEAVLTQVREAVYITPAGPDLAAAEVELTTIGACEERLARILATVREDFDYILIDTPPSLGLLTLNALIAADSVIVPLQCEYFALEGLGWLLDMLRRVRSEFNSALEIYGFVLTMFDTRGRVSYEVAREVRDHFPNKVFQSVIPRNVAIPESSSHGLSVIEYDSGSAGAQAYREFAAEILSDSVSPNGFASRQMAFSERKSWSLGVLLDREKRKVRRKVAQ
jgi:chromosome partitioning protein